MKTPFFSSLALFFFASNSFSQENGFAKFDYKTQPSSNIDIEQIELSAGFTFLKNKKGEFSNTFSFVNYRFDYNDEISFLGDLDQFNSLDYNLKYDYKINDENTISVNLNPSINFETAINGSDISVFGGIDYTKKLGTNTKIAVGFHRNKIFGKPQFLPSLLFSHTFKNNIDLGIGFPISKISYSNNERNVFSIDNNFNGYFYNTDNSVLNYTDQSAKISLSQLSTAFQYERKFDTNFIVTFKGGYDFNKKLNLQNSEDSSLHNFNISDGPTFRIGIKYQL